MKPDCAARSHARNHPLFAGMPECFVDNCLNGMSVLEIEPGYYLTREWESANNLFFILDGALLIEAWNPRGRPGVVQTLSKDAVAGWSSLFPPFRWNFGSHAVSRCRIVCLHSQSVLNACNTDKRSGYSFFQRIAGVVIERLTNLGSYRSADLSRVDRLDLNLQTTSQILNGGPGHGINTCHSV